MPVIRDYFPPTLLLLKSLSNYLDCVIYASSRDLDSSRSNAPFVSQSYDANQWNLIGKQTIVW